MVEHQTTTEFAERLESVAQLATERSVELQRPILISISEEIEPVDPLRLFANTSHFASERWYWDRPEEALTIAGSGVASGNIPPWKFRFDETERLHQEIASSAVVDPPREEGSPGPLFFAAFSFDPERKPDRRIWRGFPGVYLYVPRVSLIRRGDRHTVTFNLNVSTRRDMDALQKMTLDLRDRTYAALEKELPSGNPKVGTELTDDDRQIADAYRESVSSASQSIREGDFEKVVLARYRDIKTDNYFDIPAALDRLRTDYPGCYTFAVARHGSIFLGASPEQLVKLENKEVSAACLAGSIKRGETPAQDAELGQQLLSSAKDQHEHEVCARAIREALEPLCAEFDVPDQPRLLSFSNVHHLYTPVRGRLSNGATIFRLVERLHPTPAVGGYPKGVTTQFLREREGFDRGWYASPLGWIDSDGNGEFAVTLRSAMVSGQRARLFAGCGIVGESDPDQELAESEVKLRPMLAALEGIAR